MKNDIDAIKKAVSLVEVVKGYRIALEQRGEEFWGCCPFHTEKTPSFAIKKKQGTEVFYCQGCGKGGDVIRFVEYKDHCTTRQAIEKLRTSAGLSEEWADAAKESADFRGRAEAVKDTFKPIESEKPKVTIVMKDWAAWEKRFAESKAAQEWLSKERGIDSTTAQRMRTGFVQSCPCNLPPEHQAAKDKGWLAFPRIKCQTSDPDSEVVVAVKLRSIATKAFVQIPHMDAKALYNVESINPLEPVFVTEGELDAMVFEMCGFRAVSIPNASTKTTVDMFIALKGAPYIFLAGDNDGGAGNECMDRLHKVLEYNTFRLYWPEVKDANDFFRGPCSRDIDEFVSKVDALMEKARTEPVAGFESLLKLLERGQESDAKNDPTRFHFPKQMGDVDDMNYTPLGGVIVIYSTYSATGKTVFITQVEVEEACNGVPVLVYSPEVVDDQYLALVTAQVVGPHRDGGLNRGGQITRKDYLEARDRLLARNPDFTYYVGFSLAKANVDTTDPDSVVEFFKFALAVTGCKRLVIDTVRRLVGMGTQNENETQLEGRIVKKLDEMSKKMKVITVLVGQSNKESEGIQEVKKDEHGVLRGSKELTDVAYAVYLIHRKRKKAVEGETVQEILEADTDIILKKDRGRGTASAFVRLTYLKKFSSFGAAASRSVEASAPHGDEPPMLSDDPAF